MKSSPLQIERIKKQFFDALKTVYGPRAQEPPIFLVHLLTDKEALLKRWAEHFDNVLNRPSSVNDDAINRLP